VSRDVTRSRVAAAAAVAISVKSSVGQPSTVNVKTAMTRKFFVFVSQKRREV
jgi:hypothetical protein